MKQFYLIQRSGFLLFNIASGGARRKNPAAQGKAIYVTWLLACLLLCWYSAEAAAPSPEAGRFLLHAQHDNYGKLYTGNAPRICLQTHLLQVAPAPLLVSYARECTLRRTLGGAGVNFVQATISTPHVLTAYRPNSCCDLGIGLTEAFADQGLIHLLSVEFDSANMTFGGGGTAFGKEEVRIAGEIQSINTLAKFNLATNGRSTTHSGALPNTVTAAADQSNGVGAISKLLRRSVVCSLSPPATVAAPTYCQGSTAAPLSSNYRALAGASLLLYASATASTPLASTYVPATAVVGTTTYYASQMVGNCESTRTPLTVTVAAAVGIPTPAAALAIDGNNIAAWGDSFTDSNYGRYPQTLTQLSGRVVYNGGVGGQTSVQVKDRMVADAAKHTWPTIIWAGRNDLDNAAQVQASIATMVAALSHTNYLVLSVCNGEGEGKGTATYEQITKLNNTLAQTYGSHYLNVRSYLVSAYNPNDAYDVADHNADIPPNSLRRDFLHPNAIGSDLIAHYIYANIGHILSGGLAINYCQGAFAAPLGNSLGHAMAGASFRFYTSPAGGTALGAGSDYTPVTTVAGTQMYYVAQAVGTCESTRLPLAVVVRNCLDASFASNAPVLSAYPNPFSSQATVEVNLPSTQVYTLELYDGTGRLVQHLAVGEMGQRINYYIDARSLPDGLYVVRLSAGSDSQSLHLILSK